MSELTTTNHVSDADLARLRRKLESTRDALLAAERRTLHEQQAAGDAGPEAGDELDLAERTIEQDSALSRATLDTSVLPEVQRALAKMEAGTYGFSEDTGEPIELERLEAIPWARRTAAEEERRAVERAEPRHPQL
jgi:DnaK suppressor protein